MTVAELRERLRDLPDTAKVRICEEGEFSHTPVVEQIVCTSLGVILYGELPRNATLRGVRWVDLQNKVRLLHQAGIL